MAKTMADQKKYLRDVLSDARSSMPAERALSLSSDVQSRLLATSYYDSAAAIALYAAVGNEVATDLIFEQALADGKLVYFPRVSATNNNLALVRVHSPKDLCPGSFGILEPIGEQAAGLDDHSPTLICVPGVGFTPDGIRLGRGGGHYDRFLSRTYGSGVMAAGLAYSFQVLDQLPEAPHDRRLDFVVIESTVLVPARTSRAAHTRVDDQGGTPRWFS